MSAHLCSSSTGYTTIRSSTLNTTSSRMACTPVLLCWASHEDILSRAASWPAFSLDLSVTSNDPLPGMYEIRFAFDARLRASSYSALVATTGYPVALSRSRFSGGAMSALLAAMIIGLLIF